MTTIKTTFSKTAASSGVAAAAVALEKEVRRASREWGRLAPKGGPRLPLALTASGAKVEGEKEGGVSPGRDRPGNLQESRCRHRCSKHGVLSPDPHKPRLPSSTPPSFSFGHLRRRRRTTSDRSADENKEETEEAFLRSVAGRGEGSATRRNYPNSPRRSAARPASSPASGPGVSASITPPPPPTRVASGRALTASPSADGSSPNPVPATAASSTANGFSYREVAGRGARGQANNNGGRLLHGAGAGGRDRDASEGLYGQGLEGEGGADVERGRGGWGLFGVRKRVTM